MGMGLYLIFLVGLISVLGSIFLGLRLLDLISSLLLLGGGKEGVSVG